MGATTQERAADDTQNLKDLERKCDRQIFQMDRKARKEEMEVKKLLQRGNRAGAAYAAQRFQSIQHNIQTVRQHQNMIQRTRLDLEQQQLTNEMCMGIASVAQTTHVMQQEVPAASANRVAMLLEKMNDRRDLLNEAINGVGERDMDFAGPELEDGSMAADLMDRIETGMANEVMARTSHKQWVPPVAAASSSEPAPDKSTQSLEAQLARLRGD